MKVRCPREDKVFHSKRGYPISRVSQSREGRPKKGLANAERNFQGGGGIQGEARGYTACLEGF